MNELLASTTWRPRSEEDERIARNARWARSCVGLVLDYPARDATMRLVHAAQMEGMTFQLQFGSSDLTRTSPVLEHAHIHVHGCIPRRPFTFGACLRVATVPRTRDAHGEITPRSSWVWGPPAPSPTNNPYIVLLDMHEPDVAGINVDGVLDVGLRAWLTARGVDADDELVVPGAGAAQVANGEPGFVTTDDIRPSYWRQIAVRSDEQTVESLPYSGNIRL